MTQHTVVWAGRGSLPGETDPEHNGWSRSGSSGLWDDARAAVDAYVKQNHAHRKARKPYALTRCAACGNLHTGTVCRRCAYRKRVNKS